jgi:AP-2 complex subunit alpha
MKTAHVCFLIGTVSPMLQVGYIVTSCLLNENNDFLRMVINTVRNDIIGRNETYQCLALTMVWNSALPF